MKVGVYGAGNIGLYVGGILQQAGMEVYFVGRQRIREKLEGFGGLAISVGSDQRFKLPFSSLRLDVQGEEAADLTAVDILLVALKVHQMKSLPNPPLLKPGAVIVTLSNGLDGMSLLQELYPDHQVLRGMVGPNVAFIEGELTRTTLGQVVLEMSPETEVVVQALKQWHKESCLIADVAPVSWAKFILNTNNALHTLSGLSLRDELAQHPYRCVWAAAQREALAVCRAEGIQPATIMPVPPSWMPLVLELPDCIFGLVAPGIKNMDERSSSSMAEDLKRGVPTEVEYLNGAVERLGRKHNIPTPVNTTLVQLIREAEAAGSGSPSLTPKQLYHELRSRGWSPGLSTYCSVM